MRLMVEMRFVVGRQVGRRGEERSPASLVGDESSPVGHQIERERDEWHGSCCSSLSLSILLRVKGAQIPSSFLPQPGGQHPPPSARIHSRPQPLSLIASPSSPISAAVIACIIDVRAGGEYTIPYSHRRFVVSIDCASWRTQY